MSVRPLAVSENTHNHQTTRHSMIKLCIRIHVNIVETLACVTVFFFFAENQFVRLWKIINTISMYRKSNIITVIVLFVANNLV